MPNDTGQYAPCVTGLHDQLQAGFCMLLDERRGGKVAAHERKPRLIFRGRDGLTFPLALVSAHPYNTGQRNCFPQVLSFQPGRI